MQSMPGIHSVAASSSVSSSTAMNRISEISLISRRLCLASFFVLAGCGEGGNGAPNSTNSGGGSNRRCADPRDIEAVEVVPLDIHGSRTWTCDRVYVLRDITRVHSGTLKIEAGTTIKGENNSALVIDKGAQMIATGTEAQPIVFTSALPKGQKKRKDWGGLVFVGNALVNTESGTGRAEGFPSNPPSYGGKDPAHNCGKLSYVRVEFAGRAINDGDELNAMGFYACGSKTQMDHVQVHMGEDDGIEFFGGGFHASHIMVTGAADDALDMDLGFTGSLQFVYIQQDSAVGNNMLEVSNNSTRPLGTPITRPVIANATLVGAGVAARSGPQHAITLKEGASLGLYNSIITNTDNATIVLSQRETAAMFNGANTASAATMLGNVLWGVGVAPAFSVEAASGITEETLTTFLDTAAGKNAFADPMLPVSALQFPSGNGVPAAGGVTSTAAKELPAPFVPTNYVGAIEPGNPSPWTNAAWISSATR